MPYQREFKNRIRLGLVGAGSHAYRNIIPTLNFLPVELVAICDPETERAEITARQYGVRAVHADLDSLIAAGDCEAVLICVSPQLHPPLARQALEAGLHVWMEKPAGLSAADVETVVEARGNLTCMVGYKKAFMPATYKAEELLADPERGPLRSVLAVYPMSVPEPAPEPNQAAVGSSWLADGCHPLSFLMQVGGPVTAVQVVRGRHGGGACILQFESGAIGNLHLAEGAPRSQPFERYLLCAEDSSIEISNASRVELQRGIAFDYSETASFATPGTGEGAVVWEAQNGLNTLENQALFVQGVFNELALFCEQVKNGQTDRRGSLDFALDLSRLYDACLVSDGDWIEIGAAGR